MCLNERSKRLEPENKMSNIKPNDGVTLNFVLRIV